MLRFGDAERFEQWQVGRQQQFADVEAGVVGLFQDRDAVAPLRQYSGGSRAGRAAANYQDITFLSAFGRARVHHRCFRPCLYEPVI